MPSFKTLAAALSILLPLLAPAADRVTLTEDANSYTLANGIVTAHVSKRSGDLLSLEYKKLEMLDVESGRQEGYWSHNTDRKSVV